LNKLCRRSGIIKINGIIEKIEGTFIPAASPSERIVNDRSNFDFDPKKTKEAMAKLLALKSTWVVVASRITVGDKIRKKTVKLLRSDEL
jgi:hypothetical protein